MLARLLIVGFGIATILPALVYHGTSTVYPAPKRDAFFPRVEQPVSPSLTAEERQARADVQLKRQADFDDASRRFARVLLLTQTLAGVAAILAGSLIGAPAVGAGLMLGGVLAIGVGYVAYPNVLDDWWRFGSLLAGLAVLMFVGYRQQHRAAP